MSQSLKMRLGAIHRFSIGCKIRKIVQLKPNVSIILVLKIKAYK